MTKEQKTRQGVFWAVTIGYGLFYVCRLSLSVLKKGIVDDGFLTESELGIIGSALFFGYAVGKLFNGFLADHVNVRYFMSAALLVCAIVNAVLALKVPFLVFFILWAINGWFQSVGAPCSIISLKRWFGNDGFGTKYGYWSLSHNLGEAITFYVTALIVGAFGWQAGFLGAAGMGLLGVVLIFGLLRPFEAPDEHPGSSKDKLKETGQKQLEVLKMPIIWVLALASAFMYVARYAFTSFSVDYDSRPIADYYWGGKVQWGEEGMKCNYHWAELLFGIQSKIWGPFHLGWTLRYQRRISYKEGEHSKVWYVPGFGKRDNSAFGATFNVIVVI